MTVLVVHLLRRDVYSIRDSDCRVDEIVLCSDLCIGLVFALVQILSLFHDLRVVSRSLPCFQIFA